MRKGKGRKGVGARHTGILQQETDPEKEERKQNRKFGKESKSSGFIAHTQLCERTDILIAESLYNNFKLSHYRSSICTILPEKKNNQANKQKPQQIKHLGNDAFLKVSIKGTER